MQAFGAIGANGANRASEASGTNRANGKKAIGSHFIRAIKKGHNKVWPLKFEVLILGFQ